MPDDPATTQLQQALSLHQSGQLELAETAYRDVLRDQPKQPDALHLLGVLLLATGHLADAEAMIRAAIDVNPLTSVFHISLAQVLEARSRLPDAADEWLRAGRLDVGLHDALLRAGDLLSQQDRFVEAAEAYRLATSRRPDGVDAWNALGCVLAKSGRARQAAEVFDQAARLAPDNALIVLNLGQALCEDAQWERGADALRRALALDGSLHAAHSRLAGALIELDRLDEAEFAARRAVELAPNSSQAHHALADVLYDQGFLDECVNSYRRAIELDPGNANAHTSLLLTLHYRHGNDPELLFAEHVRWGRRHSVPTAARAVHQPVAQDENRRLRVGYLSPDFRSHSVAYFLEPILANHDHTAFEVILYSDVRVPDAVTSRDRAAADIWREVCGCKDQTVESLIRTDRVDILVDLCGHIAGNRLRLFSRKPAPVQFTYLGYPDTTGVEAIDYRLTDAWHDPPVQTERFHTERLVRLNGGAWCFLPKEDMPQVCPLPAASNGYVTFFSPNKIAKVTHDMLSVWHEILNRVPASRLIVLTGRDVRGPARIRAALSGVDSSRLQVVPRASTSEYHALYTGADVVLDTFPYNGHTTTCDALWMGLPVVTLAGQTHVSRAGVSLLSSVGLADFICHSPQEYVAQAVRIAADLDRLGELRATMRDRILASPLTDGARLAREIERAFRAAWAVYCDGTTAAARG
ncbi:MAG: tetratricopeptide repeat protein [Tepidisphaeraceae bacterium]